MSAAKEVTLHLHAVANDAAFAVLANRGHRLDRALEAVENMTCTGGHHLESLVVIVATNFTSRHVQTSVDRSSYLIYETAYRACRCSFVPPGQEMEIRRAISFSASR